MLYSDVCWRNLFQTVLTWLALASLRSPLLHHYTSPMISATIKISQPVTMARCLVTFRWLKAFVAFDTVEHAKSLTQLHDLAQKEKCLSVVPLIPHWVFPDGSRRLFLLLRVPRCNMQQHSVLITSSAQHLCRGCGNDHNTVYGLQCY